MYLAAVLGRVTEKLANLTDKEVFKEGGVTHHLIYCTEVVNIWLPSIALPKLFLFWIAYLMGTFCIRNIRDQELQRIVTWNFAGFLSRSANWPNSWPVKSLPLLCVCQVMQWFGDAHKLMLVLPRTSAPTSLKQELRAMQTLARLLC